MDDLLTVRQVAEIFQLSDKTIRRWIVAGRFPNATLITRRGGWRVPRGDVDRLLRASRRTHAD